MRQDLKQLMRPIKAKDPDKVAEEKERRKGLLKELFGVTDNTTNAEYLDIVFDELFLQIDKRGAPKGPRFNTSIHNLKLMLKISFRRKRGRARNLEEAAKHYGVSNSKFKKLRENHQNRWRDIQNYMSKLVEEDLRYRKKCKENLSKVIKSLESLVAERNELIRQKDCLTANEADQIDLKDEEIVYIDYLIRELEKSHRHFRDESQISLKALIIEKIDQISEPTEKNETNLS